MELSPYLLTIGLSWIIAQGLKYLIITLKNRKLSYFRQLYLSGNMPSAHSASTVALATMIGLSEGTEIFGLAALFAAVVMYDAVMVRRSVGEQGVALETLIRLAKNKSVIIPRAARGHTPLEVLAGAALGVAIGFIVFFATK